MMLPTGDPLGTVVTMLATPFGRLDGLAIDTAGAGGWRPTGSPPDSPSEGVIDGLPGSVSFPRRKVVVDGPPWGKIVGQRSPDTAIAVAVEDGINHGSHLGLAWPPTGAGRRQEGLQDSPLLACQITGVWLRVHTLSTFETPLLEQTLNGLFESDVITEERARDWLVRFYSKHRNYPNTKTGIVEEAQDDGYGYRNITWLAVHRRFPLEKLIEGVRPPFTLDLVTKWNERGAIGLATKEAIYPTHGPRR